MKQRRNQVMTVRKGTIFLLLFLCIMSSGQGAAAAPADEARLYQTPFAQNGTALSGVMGSKQMYFQILDYWDLTEVKLSLDYQMSPLAKDLNSSITLSVNGSPFHSFRPAAANAQKQNLAVTVPKELLTKGLNTLKVEGYIRTEDNLVCPSDQTPDQWLQLYKTSGIDVRYTQKAMQGAIQDFNQRFTGLDTVSAGRSLIAVPDKSEPAELEAAVYALSGFAKSNSVNDKDIPILPYRADNLKDREAVVLIALHDRLPAEVKGLLSKQDFNTKALIQLVSKETQPTLVITSQNPELLAKAGRLVANQPLMGQLSSDIKVVDDSTDVTTPVVPVSTRINFTEKGDELKGPGHQEQTYFVTLPANRSIADAGQISLDFRYAQNLDFNRSLVTVSINNTPIGSKKLTKELANGDTAHFAIPADLAVNGNFSVAIEFDLELEDAACTRNGDEMPWAFITKDTLIDFKTKDRNDLLFNNYPHPFLRDGVFNQVAVVIPEERDNYTYRTVSNLFNLLGKYTSGNTGDVKFYKESAGADELKERNIIAVGTYLDNKLIRDNNKNLYFKYDSAGSTFLSNEKMSIDSEYGKWIGTLQLLPSPFQSGNGFLAVTGTQAENYYLVSKLIATENSIWKVYGDGVVTDKDGNVNAHRFKKETAAEDSSLLEDIVKRGDVVGFLTALVLVAGLALVSLVLLVRKHRKKRGGEGEA
ncbi:cellulose biosynthesis cyclic di-GMP-binding regulatory protein BcsB [Paenibacillus sp. FJAT-26967]|uniref:cellulose biosynthesis cyclic di-GMP-binding regulatory protein BcsB n=1 Tax=Paenibacillus sp. FJAT-26967 TaxID=1729690 RepID=UPI0020A5CCFD|nr:cellulose biosynthesis cyclic di-GMP-binding regulatory protein BcsB [Paenibacillus sp. FJAT-26967]